MFHLYFTLLPVNAAPLAAYYDKYSTLLRDETIDTISAGEFDEQRRAILFR